MNDTIYIPEDRLQDGILQFVRSSSLASCTNVGEEGEADSRADGSIAITTSWPVAGFSSGELVAWALLRSLVSGDLRRAFERLDPDNLGALIGCLATVRGQVVTA